MKKQIHVSEDGIYQAIQDKFPNSIATSYIKNNNQNIIKADVIAEIDKLISGTDPNGGVSLSVEEVEKLKDYKFFLQNPDNIVP